jgi:hypothetical protein
MSLKDDLASVLNKYSVENESDTPDFILAKYLCSCLDAWNEAVTARDKWWNFKPWGSNETIEDSELQGSTDVVSGQDWVDRSVPR